MPPSTRLWRGVALILLCGVAWLLIHWLAPPWARQMEPENVLQMLEGFVERHGYKAVFIGALIEGLVLGSWYAPGSTVVLVAAMLAGRGVIGLPGVILSASAGFTLGYSVSFFLGRYGWVRVVKYIGLESALQRVQARVSTASVGAFVLMFAHPHCGVLAATAAGILQKPPGYFLPVLAASATFWTAFWAITAFATGRWIMSFINGPAFAIVMIGVLLLLLLRGSSGNCAKAGKRIDG